MVEWEVGFSDQEKEDIAQVAREFARGGEDLVWQIERLKAKLMGLAVRSSAKGVIVNGVKYSYEQLLHEVAIVDEIAGQSRLILQFEGRDNMSALDQRALEAGWGSIFDPDSEISKRIRSDGFKF